jgi:hypothetical protein
MGIEETLSHVSLFLEAICACTLDEFHDMHQGTSIRFSLNDFTTALATSLSLHVMTKKIGW